MDTIKILLTKIYFYLFQNLVNGCVTIAKTLNATCDRNGFKEQLNKNTGQSGSK